MNTSKMTAEQILDITVERPERLFSFDAAECRNTVRRLSRIWHPDRSRDPKASWVFAHIQSLYRAAVARIERGVWDDGNELRITSTGGRQFRLRYALSSEHELGRSLIGRSAIGYLFDNEAGAWAGAWAAAGARRVSGFEWANDAMREALISNLPSGPRLVEADGCSLLVYDKRANYVPLAALREYLGGAVPARHVAWIISGLLHIACYLEWAGLVHQAVAEPHVLVAPGGHGVSLSGGWWFSAADGDAIRALPARSAALAPPDVLTRRIADRRLDAILIRQLGLELLGADATSAPAAMLNYLSLPGIGAASDDYAAWHKALWTSFGERRFSELAVSSDDIYSMASPSTAPERT